MCHNFRPFESIFIFCNSGHASLTTELAEKKKNKKPDENFTESQVIT